MAVPPQVTNVVATAFPGRIKLTWDPSENTRNYRIARATGQGGTYQLIETYWLTTEYEDYNVVAGTMYRYAVASENSEGRLPGVSSNYVTAVADDRPEIIIQNNASENNMVTKSVTDLFDVIGYLRDGTSIVNPVFLVEADFANLSTANYLTVPNFHRSYFITNIVLVRTGLVEIHCHVDVLSSFASEIKANKGIVRKAEGENAYNLYIDDGSLVSYGDPYILTEPFPSGFDGHTFILACAGST